MTMSPPIPVISEERRITDGRNAFRLIASAAGLTLALLGGWATAADAGAADAFTFNSPDLAAGKFDKKFTLNAFGCTGANVSPSLEWRHAPAGTKAFAIQVIDLDSPGGITITHWAIYNIPGTLTELSRGAGNSPSGLPAPAFGGNTDFLDTGVGGGNGNYAGPCPPAGDKPHKYQFTIYAYAMPDLQAAAGVPRTGTAGLYGFVLNKGIGNALLGKASFIAEYGR
jgi:Raf kinase inhibitor-like YbhB/YbcL family protein